MSQLEKSIVKKSLLYSPRRTQSVDDHSFTKLTENHLGISENHINSVLDQHPNSMTKLDDENVICVPLLRSSGRPTAKTCWRARPAFAPSPECNFGPKGTLKKVQNNEPIITIQDPSSQRLHWISSPNNILIIRKPGQTTLREFRIIVIKLLKRDLNVFVEPSDIALLPLKENGDLIKYSDQCITFDNRRDSSKIDLIICIGGDGTLLHVSSIFQKSCPPILSFSMGSLGFLTPFDFHSHEQILNAVFTGDVSVLLRARLNCTIIKSESNNLSSSDTPYLSLRANDKLISNHDTDHLVLNEVVIDRGPNSYLSNIDLFINDRFITKVQGDGLIISTPTGSTAYAMAAGASMVHPNVPAIVICPVCPHSLSFRPIVVPAGIELTVKVCQDSRLTAWLSVDGRNRVELQPQDSVRITTSVYPIPSICRFDQLGDWFESLADILHWNLRKTQLSFDAKRNSAQDEEPEDLENEFEPSSSFSSNA